MYSTLRRPSSAFRHARRCLEIIEENGITGFYRASAYEGLAKAHSVEEERKLLFDQGAEIPEYG